MVNDRAGHARHEGPVLPSREVNRTQLRAGLQTTSPSSEARHDRATHAKHQDSALPQTREVRSKNHAGSSAALQTWSVSGLTNTLGENRTPRLGCAHFATAAMSRALRPEITSIAASRATPSSGTA